MIISLLGYMGSGKSYISRILSQKINYKIIDLDEKISEQLRLSISEIFEKRGELYFRKIEKEILSDILMSRENTILSLGGGTPVYYENMSQINKYSKSIFLRASIDTLSNRLIKQKASRPLISRLEDSDIPEFIAKHLFERNEYYSKAHFIIDVDSKSEEETIQIIINKIKIEN